MKNFKHLVPKLVAVLASFGLAGAANAATVVATTALQTYAAPGVLYTLTFESALATPAYLTYTDYFGPVDPADIDGSSTVLLPALGSYTPAISFAAPVSVTYVLTPSVPEPATWAMMLVGLGAAGLGLRGSSRRNLRVT